jgi:hypothetical protein
LWTSTIRPDETTDVDGLFCSKSVVLRFVVVRRDTFACNAGLLGGRAIVPDRRQENLIVAGPSLTGAGSITENARSVVKSFPIF